MHLRGSLRTYNMNTSLKEYWIKLEEYHRSGAYIMTRKPDFDEDAFIHVVEVSPDIPRTACETHNEAAMVAERMIDLYGQGRARAIAEALERRLNNIAVLTMDNGCSYE